MFDSRWPPRLAPAWLSPGARSWPTNAILRGPQSGLRRSRDCVADSPRKKRQTADWLGGWGQGIQELPEKPSHLLRLFESRVVPGPGDDAHLAAGNVLSHEFGLVRSGENVFIAGDQQGGHVDGLKSFDRVRAIGHAALEQGHVLRRRPAHHAESGLYQIGTGLARRRSERPLQHGLKERLGAAFDNIVG